MRIIVAGLSERQATQFSEAAVPGREISYIDAVLAGGSLKNDEFAARRCTQTVYRFLPVGNASRPTSRFPGSGVRLKLPISGAVVGRRAR
jgi:hypothetical protein